MNTGRKNDSNPGGNDGPDFEELRQAGHRALDLAVDYLASIRQRPVFQQMQPPQRQELLDLKLPEHGISENEALDFIQARVMSHPMGNGHPRFFGWVNSPPMPQTILAELLAATLNPSCAGGDHAAIYLERAVVRWLMEMVGFEGEGSLGLLVSGGSMASLTCLAAARNRACWQAGLNVRQHGLQGAKLVLYISEETHSCIQKAVELMGLGSDSIRRIGVDERFRLRLDLLEEAIRADLAAGLQPFCVVANAGTVNTGAVDRFDLVADLCEKYNLWLHVDGAYGGVGRLDPAKKDLYRGLERANSMALDTHKWLSVPVECGCAMVRDSRLLRETFSLVPSYLQTEEGKGFGGLPWYSEYGFQQSRGFRALKLWMALSTTGFEGYRRIIARHNHLANYLATLIEDSPDFELMSAVELSIVCFRYNPPALQENSAALNRLNKEIMERVQAGGEAFITSTSLRGNLALRACILHYATGEADIRALLEIIRKEARDIAL